MALTVVRALVSRRTTRIAATFAIACLAVGLAQPGASAQTLQGARAGAQAAPSSAHLPESLSPVAPHARAAVQGRSASGSAGAQSRAVVRRASRSQTSVKAAKKYAGANSYSINLGYADTLRPNPVNFPTPWDGSPNVVFEGCQTPCSGGLDGGAIEIINTSSAAETFQSVIVNLGPDCIYDIWPHDVSVPKGDELIITENAGGGPGGCTVSSGQMDTSDIGPDGANWAGNCNQSGLIPVIEVTENNNDVNYNDSTQILNTGGVDADSCGHPNESEQWTPIGATVCYGSTLTATPGYQSDLPGATASVTAKLLNSCGDPLQGAQVDLNVTSGPNAGTAVTGTTGTNGTVKLSYSGETEGIDNVSVTVPNTAGTISANPVSVVWETAALTLSPSSGLPGATVNFSGTGYSAGETVVIDENSVGGTQLASVVASGSGTISGSFTVPAPTSSGGMTAAVAIGQTSGKEGWAAFSSSCTDDWVSTSGGNWTNASDWSTGAVPGGSDVACILIPGTYTVTSNNSETIAGLILGTNATKSPGTQTLDFQSAGSGAVTLNSGSTTISKHGVFDLDSQDADQGSYITGGPITNAGSFQTLADAGAGRYIRANFTNTGTVTIGGSTNFDQAYTFTNNGTLTVSSGGSFTTNGGSTFTQGTGSIANGGTFVVVDSTFNQSGGSETGSSIEFENSTVNDSAGTGALLFLCTETLTGTVASGQNIDVQASGCGNGVLNISGTVVNNGTVSLDSTDGDASSYLDQAASGASFTNNGTFQTIGGSLGARYVHLNFTNAGTVIVNAANSFFDQGYTLTNNGAFTVTPGGSFTTNGNATFLQDASYANNGDTEFISTYLTLGGTSFSGNQAFVQSSTVTDVSAGGSFIFQCSNNLEGVIPSSQTVTVQTNSCGSASLQLIGNVDNAGTLALDSLTADASVQLYNQTGSDTLTNDGTFETLQDSGNTRYIRLNLVNDADGTVVINASDSRFDQAYTFTNNGSFTVAAAGGFTSNGNATFLQDGTFANNGYTAFLSTYLTLGGTSFSGNQPIVQGTNVTDGSGGGSFLFQCSNNLAGTVPSGQTILVQANGCGSAALDLQGNVDNLGTINLDSIDSDNYVQVYDSTTADTLTNDGTFETTQDSGNTRYIRLNFLNDADGTIVINASDSRFDQGYLFTNNGSFTVGSGGGFTTNGNATFVQDGTFTNNGYAAFLDTNLTLGGTSFTGNQAIVQGSSVTDGSGGGSFLFQCANSLTGSIPSGQTVDVQANGCGAATLTLEGNVSNAGTLDLDSVDADNYSLVTDSVSGGTLTNTGTFQTLAGNGGLRYLRVNLNNKGSGTVSIAAATHQDSSTTDMNAGTWNVKDGGSLSLNSGSAFSETAGSAKTGVTIDTATGVSGISGGTITVSGTLTVTTVGTPASGTAYVVIAAQSGDFIGTFSTIKTGSTGYTPTYTTTSLTLTAN